MAADLPVSADIVHVSAGILVRDGFVLACQRRADQAHALKWEFPGGKCEAGETAAACLVRELREELGIEAEIGAVLWSTEHAYPGRTVALTFFRVERWRGEIENRVFAALSWVAAEGLAERDFIEADRELIRLVGAGRIALGPA